MDLKTSNEGISSKRIKILWISRHAPVSITPEAGSHTFLYYFRNIAEDGNFDVRFISCAWANEKDAIENENAHLVHHVIYWSTSLSEKLRNIINIESKYNWFNRYGNIISNSDERSIIKAVKKYKADGYVPDIVILEWTGIVVLAKLIKKFFPASKIVASEHDVTYVGFYRKASYYTGIKKVRWYLKATIEKKAELKGLRECDLILPHNSDNCDLLINEGLSEAKIRGLVPFYNSMSSCKRVPNHKDILFYGAMARAENYLSAIWFIEKVMPRIRDLDIRFIVLGSKPPKELKQLENKKVLVTGFVQEVEPYFEQAMCLAAPLVLGAGIKVKILEAMSSGVPVITNSIGIEGISVRKKIEYFHCEEPAEYEEAIRGIYTGEYDAEKIALAAKNFLKLNFELKNSLEQYKGELKILMKEGNTNESIKN